MRHIGSILIITVVLLVGITYSVLIMTQDGSEEVRSVPLQEKQAETNAATTNNNDIIGSFSSVLILVGALAFIALIVLRWRWGNGSL